MGWMTLEEWQGIWKLTEAQWLTWTDPEWMLRFLEDKASDRKIRLFACHCCRRVRRHLLAEKIRAAVEIAEQFADGRASEEDFIAAHSGAIDARGTTSVSPESPEWTDASLSHYDPDMIASEAAASCSSPHVYPPGRGWRGGNAVVYVGEYVRRVLAFAAAANISDGNKTYNATSDAEKCAQCRWLRDIIGNPFRQVTFSPEWRTDTAVTLAQTMYDSRDFSAMPILADALQDANCDNEEVLNHCRDPQQTHVRGCWVVDLVLGKN